jgi:8-oxo-dGTP pyrophosphatase MutT (NUDIX family)
MPHSLRTMIVRTTQARFTISAAAVVLNDSSEVLLLNHVLRPHSGWGFPGGFLDAGEQPVDAIKREVFEETGIELNSLILHRVRTTKRHTEIIFLARSSDEAKVSSREIYELCWFAADKLPQGISRAMESLIREVLRREI